MAYFKIETDRKGNLKARIQVSGKDYVTNKTKLFVKKVYNTENLTEAKFRKYVDKVSIEFEDEVAKAYKEQQSASHNKVLTFSELANEWLNGIQANLSYNYYDRATDVCVRFKEYLRSKQLIDRPLSDITVRDIQLYLNSFSEGYNTRIPLVKMKKDLPKEVNFRALERENIITRCSSYGMRKNGNNISLKSAKLLCEKCGLNFNEYFEDSTVSRQYSAETIKGHRRVLRTLFNEAVRYDWITKNPVCKTKIGAGNSNSCLREVPEKEVFSFTESKTFIEKLNEIPKDFIYKKIPFELMILTGMRCAEVCGLRWSNIDLEKGILHVEKNRLTRKGMVYEKDPKTKTSKREIPIPQILIDDLKEYYKWFEEADGNFKNKLDEYYLAVNMYREPLYPNTLGHWLKIFEMNNGLKEVTCHGLRHTYCSLLLSQNVPIQTVSKYMGHSDSTITLKVYSHFIPDTQDRVLYALNALAT